MPINLPELPFDRQAATDAIRKMVVSYRFDCRECAPNWGNSRNVDAAGPIPVFVVSEPSELDNLNSTPEPDRLWRYLLIGASEKAIIDVRTEKDFKKFRFAGYTWGTFAENTFLALKTAAANFDSKQGEDLELWILELLSLDMTALWLRKADGRGYIIPIARSANSISYPSKIIGQSEFIEQSTRKK